ncbi:MAG: helix-turn-helix domain-containing protein [Kiritimatiellae bacterium]|jgi:AraC-like DNA-binding protein|nr:helix-turn-helix domain-containing protein [Kiritimatiellia bacterium]
MGEYAYGQTPPDIGERALSLSWLAGARHLKAPSAGESFWHAHGEAQLMYCFKGEFGYEFEGRASAVLTAGHYIVIPARLRHRHLQAIDPAGHRIELLVRPPRREAAFSLFPRSVAKSLLGSLLAKACRPVQASRDLARAFLRLDALAERGEKSLSPEELALARTLASLAFHICAGEDADVHGEKPGVRLMDEATSWLERHFAENVRMDALVAYMGYSRSRLFDLFRRHTGLSPADYLARYRIRMARRMLERTDRKVTEISRACGFSSAQYFNSAFRRQTGLTPSAWREKSRAHICDKLSPEEVRRPAAPCKAVIP